MKLSPIGSASSSSGSGIPSPTASSERPISSAKKP